MSQKHKPLEQSLIQEDTKTAVVGQPERPSFFNPRFIGMLADEVAKLVIKRLPKLPEHKRSKPKTVSKKKELLGAYFLDTSAIIDGRIFDIIQLGLLSGTIVVLDGVLLELKHIADAKDPIKKERGRKGLEFLGKVKKTKSIKVTVLPEDVTLKAKHPEVDEQLIWTTKANKGKLITCDYNLEKKAHVHGISAINIHALAQLLKVAAIPGESVQVKISHVGKDTTQGVGYLDDGTMVVVEKSSAEIGKVLSVLITRVIQTSSGKILFAKKQ